MKITDRDIVWLSGNNYVKFWAIICVAVEQGHQWRAQTYTALPKHVTNIAVSLSCLPNMQPNDLNLYKMIITLTIIILVDS
jgi:hypothetical protein